MNQVSGRDCRVGSLSDRVGKIRAQVERFQSFEGENAAQVVR